MSLLLLNWAKTVNGKAVSVAKGRLLVDGTEVGTVTDHPVQGYVVRLNDYRTIDAPTLQTAAKAALGHMLEAALDWSAA